MSWVAVAATALPPLERVVVEALDGRGRMDHAQVAGAASLGIDEVDRALKSLISDGIVTTTEQDGEMLYELSSKSTAAPARSLPPTATPAT